MVAKTPRLLTAEQRDAFVRIPTDLSEWDLGRFYTLSARDLVIVDRHRRPANRLGFAVHLGLLRFPGRTLADVPEVPFRVVQYIAEQVGVDPDVFEHYGERDNTIFEHLDELRREFGFQNCGWPQLHALGRELLRMALESDRSSGASSHESRVRLETCGDSATTFTAELRRDRNAPRPGGA